MINLEIKVIDFLEGHYLKQPFQFKLNNFSILDKVYNVIEFQNFLKEKPSLEIFRKSIISFRKSANGIRINANGIFPTLTYSDVQFFVFDQQWRELNQKELINLQNYPSDFQFPPHFQLKEISSMLGNGINYLSLSSFLDKLNLPNNLQFIDLFCGLGTFHIALKKYNAKCILANDKVKKCQEVYNLNFSNTPFLLGNIKSYVIQEKIMNNKFNLLTAGFPCVSFSKAGKRNGDNTYMNILLKIIEKKLPQHLLFENVPNIEKYQVFQTFIQSLKDLDYSIQSELINSFDLGSLQNRKRLFIYCKREITSKQLL